MAEGEDQACEVVKEYIVNRSFRISLKFKRNEMIVQYYESLKGG